MAIDDTYLQQQDALETFFDFHPEAFEDIPPEEMRILAEYYFVNREIDVPNIAEHASNLTKNSPATKTAALRIARKVFDNVGLGKDRIKELLDNQ